MNERLDLVITDILIGQKIIIHQKNNKITGMVINETRNTLILETDPDKKIKIYPKNNNNKIERIYKKKKLLIDGSLLKGRPEERLKNEPRKKW